MAAMAEPFIKMKRFLAWAMEKHECTCRSGYMSTPEGMETFTVVTSPTNRQVIIADVNEDESIPESAYEYYTRRLGLPKYEDPEGRFAPWTTKPME